MNLTNPEAVNLTVALWAIPAKQNQQVIICPLLRP
jgi:hypothetical protein